MTSPFEDGVHSTDDDLQARPMPCPECGSTRGYSRVGKYRAQCLGCNALLKNEEVDMQLSEKER
jgi:hypothetical protein